MIPIAAAGSHWERPSDQESGVGSSEEIIPPIKNTSNRNQNCLQRRSPWLEIRVVPMFIKQIWLSMQKGGMNLYK